MARSDEPKKKKVILVEGRMINGSLFEKDKFDEKSEPKYKIELAMDKAAADAFYDEMVEYATERFGKNAADDLEAGDILSPILDGDALARKREKKGKKGDAYKGLEIIRASTQFNWEGDNAPGGIFVCDEDAERIDYLDREGKAKLYNGCYVKAALTFGDYEDSKTGADAIMCYLSAVQKIDDGERLVSSTDYSQVFKPTGRKASGGERRTRARGEDDDETPRRRSRTEEEPVRRRAR